MFDVASLPTVINSVKTAVETLASLKSLKGDPDAKAALDEVERALLEARAMANEAQLREWELMQKLKALQAEFDESKAWRNTLEKYEEVSYGEGKSAYRLKTDYNSCEGDCYACPKCIGEKKISHLQFQNRTYEALDFYKCYDCGGEFFYGTSNGDSGIQTVSAGRGWSVFDV
ncbi:hypothetical protein [Hoeflea prorocentri]|uniref:Uncharacterized protein n=1 Tax=Hoeflea prorocentri TaxID=1922333 RepID=A0A9X3UJL7_9HYPH|nr:hypothetical protein [Hoeflea prorocentri]MCY6382562.1 hypothetical protein [Hoeflea prorocentri]MDA5400362.1 hypothetical protein [Hoeflea prorocentri]